jgi:hypothetical protein
MKKLLRWFDLNVGWFFVNPMKEEKWLDHLRKKYKL